MLTSHRIWAFSAGIVAGFLFILAASGSLASVLLLYVPFLPLLMAGLALGSREGFIAAATGSLLAGIFTGMGGLLLFTLLIAVPCAFFSYRALARKGHYRASIGRVLTEISFYAVIMASLFTLVIMNNEQGFAVMLPPVQEGEPDFMGITRDLITAQPHLMLAISAWLQLSLFYGLAVLANALLAQFSPHTAPSQRDSLAVRPFMPSAGLLVGLMLAGLLSFTTDPAWSVIGKTAFMTLLFPYFLMGLSTLHHRARNWPNRGILLTLVYFFVSLIPYLVVAFIGLGLVAQGRYLSNRFSHSGGDGTE